MIPRLVRALIRTPRGLLPLGIDPRVLRLVVLSAVLSATLAVPAAMGIMALRPGDLAIEGMVLPVEATAGLILFAIVGAMALASLLAERSSALSQSLAQLEHAATALRESEARYRTVVEHSIDGIGIVLDCDSIVYTNTAMARLLGAATPQQLDSKLALHYVHPDDRTPFQDWRTRRASGEPAPERLLCRLRGEGNQPRTVEFAMSRVPFDGQTATLLQARDVTNRQQAEAADRERQRLDGALLMARTTAHELNNALALVVGYAELVGHHSATRQLPELAPLLTELMDGGQRAGDQIQRLQAIVRLEEMPSPLGLDATVLDIERSTATTEPRSHKPTSSSERQHHASPRGSRSST